MSAESNVEEKEIRGDVEDKVNSSDEEGDDVMDSSEEEEEEDEEAFQKVRDGFIVDDDESDGEKRRKKKHKKRRREKERADDGALDEDDLELLLENSGAKPREKAANKFKRLKSAQGTADDDADETAGPGAKKTNQGLTDMFSDDNEALEDEEGGSPAEAGANILDEFEDFIEEDEFSDEEEASKAKATREHERTKRKGVRIDTMNLSNVDRESLQQLYEVFGSGGEYEWALEAQEIEDQGNGENLEPTSLDEVFEHAELKERMLTEEDNLIRIIDMPERFQTYRANMTYIDLEGEELTSEKDWIANVLFLEKHGAFDGFLEEPFKEAVGKVVEFISKDSYEIPFIWTHRRDFLLFSQEAENPDGTVSNAVHKLLFEDDLWRILQLDLEYHSLYEKRIKTLKFVEKLNIDDDLAKDINTLDTMVAVQDVHDYLQFTYSSEIRQLSERAENEEKTENGEDEEPQTVNKKHSKFALYERIKSNVLYDAVAAFGITSKQFGENVQDQSSKNFQVPYRIHATDDPLESPEDLIEKLVEDDEVLYKDLKSAGDAVRKTFAEEIFHNPKIRSEVRSTYSNFSSISVTLTDKGRSIDNSSPYADIKYATNRTPVELVRNPELFLRMLEAEELGLLVVRVETKDFHNWFQCIFNCLKSDGTSDIADSWNRERERVLQIAFKRLTTMVSSNTKEDLRRECQRLIAAEVRRRFLAKIDQAPYTPYGFDKGTKPNVLALSFGTGDLDNAVIGCFLRDNGKVDQYFKSDNNPIKDRESEEKFFGQLKEYFDKNLDYQKPDVIVISGFNAHTKRFFDSMQTFVQTNSITVNTDELNDVENPPLLQVIWGQDETARLYQNSERAKLEYSDKPSLVKYCIALGRYVQSPLLEYVSLGEDILSLSFYEHQKLIPNDSILEAIESAYVDIVNMVGVDINEAVRDSYTAQLLPYVAGLGKRKASGLIRNINSKLGSMLSNRSDLIESELTTANIFINCSSFLSIPYDESSSLRDSSVELLDATRIHPEDYDLARKMAADALDLDEEDMAHVEEEGGIIYQLMQDGVNKVDELNLTAYGKELETKFGKKKYATLQSIKEELVNNFEELRRSFHILDNYEVFHMLTGETPKTFGKNTIAPVTASKVGKNFREYQNSRIRFVKVVTTSLIQGNIDESHIPQDIDIDQGQVLQAVVLDVAYDQFSATFSLLDADLKRANAPKFNKEVSKWDFEAEEADTQRELAKERAKMSKTRNIQHPLYHNFSFKQAEEFLAPQAVGDCVIRPSSKGPDYLTVTWKVSNNLFQHLLVQENNFGRRKEYTVDHKKYADLDQLIFQHIQAIAKRVNEMTRHPKFREGTLAEVNEWLESYTKANPKNSAYVFCFDHKTPGNFLLLFKVNVSTPISTWHVRTEADGYTLKGFSYPNMLRLCNGFKQTFKSYVSSSSKSRGPQNGQQAASYGSYGY